MPIKIWDWQATPGSDLPKPIVSDDRQRYPMATVRAVLAYARAKRAELLVRGPSPRIQEVRKRGRSAPVPAAAYGVIFLPQERNRTTLLVGGPWAAGMAEWEYGVFELLLRRKSADAIVARYLYSGARELSSGHVILEGEMRVQREDTVRREGAVQREGAPVGGGAAVSV